MKYIFKELRRHYWRTIFSITGYAIASIFILIILCITGSNKKDSFGILQSTGTHFIVYIPSKEVVVPAIKQMVLYLLKVSTQ